jgi:5,10-methylenetetrahydrofolate reductase
MAKEYKDSLKQLGDRLKNEPINTPIQEVRPVEKPATAPKQEAHVNFWVPDELMERLKIHAAKNKKTIKQIGIEAFEQYLANNK